MLLALEEGNLHHIVNSTFSHHSSSHMNTREGTSQNRLVSLSAKGGTLSLFDQSAPTLYPNLVSIQIYICQLHNDKALVEVNE